MDFMFVFLVKIFLGIYGVVLFIVKYFTPAKPKQLLSYNKDTDEIFVEGYHGEQLIKFRLHTFKVKGHFEVKINGSPITTFLPNSIEGLSHEYTYFMGDSYYITKEDVELTVYNINHIIFKLVKLEKDVLHNFKDIIESTL